MRLGFDLDGVGATFHETSHGLLYKDVRHDRGPEDLPIMWEVWEHYGMTEAEWTAYIRRAVKQGLFADLEVRPGFAKMLGDLADEGHTIHIITHRHGDGAEPDTKTWLDKHGIFYDTLTFSEDKTAVETDFFLEDNPAAVKQLRYAGCCAFLLTRPWNKTATMPWRVEDFDGFIKAVEFIGDAAIRHKVANAARKWWSEDETATQLPSYFEPERAPISYDIHAQPGTMRYDLQPGTGGVLNKIGEGLDDNGVEFVWQDQDTFNVHTQADPDQSEIDVVAEVRKFESGALRDSEAGKVDFEGALSPTVLQRYAEYMLGNTTAPDGSQRTSDNWQKGIPVDSYMRSLWRHMHDVWMLHRGNTPRPEVEDIEEALCGVLFNAMGMLHEILKQDDHSDVVFPPATDIVVKHVEVDDNAKPATIVVTGEDGERYEFLRSTFYDALKQPAEAGDEYTVFDAEADGDMG